MNNNLKLVINNTKSKNLEEKHFFEKEELKIIFRKRELSHFFTEIYGSPSNKVENIVKIQKHYEIQDKVVFFGDSLSDYEAAKYFGMDFVFISGVSEWKNVHKNVENKLVNFNDTLKILQ